MENWVYYGIFFSQPTRQYLIQRAKELVNIPENWKLHGDHMTIIYSQLPTNEFVGLPLT